MEVPGSLWDQCPSCCWPSLWGVFRKAVSHCLVQADICWHALGLIVLERCLWKPLGLLRGNLKEKVFKWKWWPLFSLSLIPVIQMNPSDSARASDRHRNTHNWTSHTRVSAVSPFRLAVQPSRSVAAYHTLGQGVNSQYHIKTQYQGLRRCSVGKVSGLKFALLAPMQNLSLEMGTYRPSTVGRTVTSQSSWNSRLQL